MSNKYAIEQKLHIVLPQTYKNFIENNKESFDMRWELKSEEEDIKIKKFLTVEEIESVYDEYKELFGYDIVPIAVTDYEDYVCVNYRDREKEPNVIYWSFELCLEDPKEGIFFIADDFAEFEGMICEDKTE